MKTILERVSEIANNENITITALEKKIGASAGVLSRAIRNNTDIQAKWVQCIIENYPLYNANWLLTGEGSVLKSDNKTAEDNDVILSEGYQHYEIANYGIPKPFIDSVDATCGYPNGFSVAIMAKDCENIIIPFMGEYDFSIRARGDSMINRNNPSRSIRERDIVVCKLWKSRTHIRWGEIYALATSEGVIVKKIMESDTEGHIRCVSFNTEDGYKPYDLPLEEIHDWAIVVGVASINTW